MNNIKLSFSILLIFLFMIKLGNAQNLQTQNEKQIVFLGNSITENWKNLDPNFFSNKAYINKGISGQTTPQILNRFKKDVIDLNPNVVVILAGINDIAENTGPITLKEISENIFSMVEQAKANGIKVILCSVLPANKFPWRPDIQPEKKVVSLNKILNNYAKQNSIIYLDYYAAMVDQQMGLMEQYTYDGVHPNKVGYKFMEPLVEGAIREVLHQKVN